jgi:hypothetical protein
MGVDLPTYMVAKRIEIVDVIAVLRGRAIGVDRNGILYYFKPDYQVKSDESKVRLMREACCRAEWIDWQLLDIQPSSADLEDAVMECKALLRNWRSRGELVEVLD